MPPEGTKNHYICALYDSIAEVAPADWMSIVNERGDLAMDRRLIAALEQTLTDQCRVWTAMIRDERGEPVACACLCLFRVDAVVSAHPLIRRIVRSGRRAFRSLFRIGVLFCGLPVPAGENHLRIAPNADPERAFDCLHDAMRTLARRHRASLLVFKEFDAGNVNRESHLSGHGYITGDVPQMHRLAARFEDFDDFLASMRSRYRAQVRRSLRKIETGGFVIDRYSGSEAIVSAFTRDVYDLYLRVWERSRYQLERLPRAYFLAAAEAAEGDAALTVIRKAEDGAPAGFTFSISRGETWHNLYSGVDYSINGEGDILFNLFYADLAWALKQGSRDIRLGQTGDLFKSRLGTAPQPLRFFVRARSPVAQLGLRLFSRALFPSVPPPPCLHVFKDMSLRQCERSAARSARSSVCRTIPSARTSETALATAADR